MDPAPFDGSGDASAWLKAFEDRSKKKSPSWKMKRFEKLIEKEAKSWWYGLRGADHWDTLRAMFVAYWIDGLREEKAPKAPAVVHFVKTEPPPPVFVNPPSPPASEQPETTTFDSVFSVLVDTVMLDPKNIYTTAYAQFSEANDKEGIFRVIWDAAYAAGTHNGHSEGRKGAEKQWAEKEKQLRHALAQRDEEIKSLQEKEKSKTTRSICIDTSDLIPPRILVSSSAQTPAESSTVPQSSSKPQDIPSSKLDWAEDSDTIPPAVLIPSTMPPRDFSALRTSSGSSRPFGSLQRRVHRSHHRLPRKMRQNFSFNYSTQPTVPTSSSFVFTHSHPSGIGEGKPKHTSRTPCTAPQSEQGCRPPLGWVLDPRLVRLGQVLFDLGWIGH